MLDLKDIYAKEYERLLEEDDNKALEISDYDVKVFLDSIIQKQGGKIENQEEIYNEFAKNERKYHKVELVDGLVNEEEYFKNLETLQKVKEEQKKNHEGTNETSAELEKSSISLKDIIEKMKK